MSDRAQSTQAPDAAVFTRAELVFREQVRALYAQTPQGIMVGLVLGALFVFVFRNTVDMRLASVWFAATLVSHVGGWWLWRRFVRLDATGDWHAPQLLRDYFISVIVAGLLLGLTGLVFYSPEFGDRRWYTVLCITGIAAGSVTSYAYHPPILNGFLVVLFLPLGIQFARSSPSLTWVPVFVLLFYLGMLVQFGRNQSKVLLQSIHQRHENAELVRQLQAQAQALEQAAQAKAQFFAAASHDLRQPLQALGYYSSLLKPHDTDAPVVQRIQQCVDSLDGLLDGVLSISRLDAGKVQAHVTSHDLTLLLQRLCGLYEGVAQAKGLTLRLRFSRSEAGRWGRTDPVLLERVLGNLLSNAVRYTANGGILVILRSRGQNWRIQVIDTGLGIAAEHLELVFDEFVQLGNLERDADQGVGLGLATARRICNLLHHPIHLNSRLRHGSVFSVDVPKAAPEVQQPERETSSNSPALRGQLLLVEDNLLVRESLMQTLVGWGLQVHACNDGEQAWAWLNTRAAPPDVVLSDWRLPGQLNGLALFDRLRTAGDVGVGCLPAMVLMTGEGDFSVGDVPRDVVVLKKPLRPLQLRSVLTAKLPHGQSA